MWLEKIKTKYNANRLRSLIFALGFCLLCFVVLYNILFLNHHWSSLWRKEDFNHYYASAYLARLGVGPYGVNFSGVDALQVFIWHPFIKSATNPPLLILLTLPLTLFEPQTAWYIWEVVVVSSAILSCRLIISSLGSSWKRRERCFLYLFLSASWPLLQNIFYSQFQTVLLLLCLLVWRAARAARISTAAVWMALLLNLKFIGLPIALFLVLRYGWRLFRSLLIASLLFSLVPMFYFGVGVYSQFANFALPLLKLWSGSSLNISFGGALYNTLDRIKLLPDAPGACGTLFLVLLPLVLSLSIAARLASKLGEGQAAIDLGFSVLLPLSFLCTGLAWHSYLIVLLFTFSLYWAYSRKNSANFFVILLFWGLLGTKPKARF